MPAATIEVPDENGTLVVAPPRSTAGSAEPPFPRRLRSITQPAGSSGCWSTNVEGVKPLKRYESRNWRAPGAIPAIRPPTRTEDSRRPLLERVYAVATGENHSHETRKTHYILLVVDRWPFLLEHLMRSILARCLIPFRNGVSGPPTAAHDGHSGMYLP